MRIIFLLFVILSFLLLNPATVQAKVLPQALTKSGQATKTPSTGSTIGVFPKLRLDRKALLVTFTGLENATSISYFLTYTSNGTNQAAGGTVSLDGSSTANRELLFGTCSTRVCTYNTGITNAKFEVTTELKNGKKTLRRYRIKI